MKHKIYLTALVCFASYLSAHSQTDTIFKVDGKKLLVNISEITENAIKYQYPNESLTNSVEKLQVEKVHFKSGRKEKYATSFNVSTVSSCLDWNNVQFSKIESEVKGMHKLTNVGSKAKGMTAYSSIAKLQDRAFNKAKMQTAMIGGNTIFILEQNTEESMFGGKYGSSKLPSVTISGLAYTSKIVKANQIPYGKFSVKEVYVLETNAYELEKINLKTTESFDIKEGDLIQQNDFLKISLTSKNVDLKITEYTIISASETEIVLSGVYIAKKGKTTYYNIFLSKIN